jgi:hypothetical protein
MRVATLEGRMVYDFIYITICYTNHNRRISHVRTKMVVKTTNNLTFVMLSGDAGFLYG